MNGYQRLVMRYIVSLAITLVCILNIQMNDLYSGETDGTAKVTVLAFSGRENPVFHLNENEFDILKEKLGPIPDNIDTTVPEFPAWPIAGIGGFLISSQDISGFPQKIHVYTDLITLYYPDGQVIMEDTKGLDDWLVSLAKERISGIIPSDWFKVYTDRIFAMDQNVHQTAYVLAHGIEDDGVYIALCEVMDFENVYPHKQEYKVLTSDTLKLVKMKVIKPLRGTVDTSIFVIFSKKMVENLRYKSFQPQAIGSIWLLFLESPFDNDNPFRPLIPEILKDIDTNDSFSPTNLFTIYYYGYGALCVDWPISVARHKTMPLATPNIVNDINSVLEFRLAKSTFRVDTTTQKQLEGDLQTKIGSAILKKLIDIK